MPVTHSSKNSWRCKKVGLEFFAHLSCSNYYSFIDHCTPIQHSSHIQNLQIPFTPRTHPSHLMRDMVLQKEVERKDEHVCTYIIRFFLVGSFFISCYYLLKLLLTLFFLCLCLLTFSSFLSLIFFSVLGSSIQIGVSVNGWGVCLLKLWNLPRYGMNIEMMGRRWGVS